MHGKSGSGAGGRATLGTTSIFALSCFPPPSFLVPRWRRPRPAAAAPWQPPKVSTLASWTSIVYTTWYGCESYIASPYSPDNPSKVATDLGAFQGYKCYDIPAYSDAAKPGLALVFYQVAQRLRHRAGEGGEH